MAFGAMARPLNQVGAAVPGRAFRRVGGKNPIVEEKELPQPEAAAEGEDEGQVVRAGPAFDDRKRLHEGEEVAHVRRRHALVRGVGERRVVMPPVRGDAAAHGAQELLLSPAADAVPRMRRDVRGVEGAEGGGEREAAAEARLVVLLGRGVARGAAAGEEHRSPVGEVGLAGRHRLEPGALPVGARQEPEAEPRKEGETKQNQDAALHPVPP
jgi:hypothetical protein